MRHRHAAANLIWYNLATAIFLILALYLGVLFIKDSMESNARWAKVWEEFDARRAAESAQALSEE
jgi:hypothetical protein